MKALRLCDCGRVFPGRSWRRMPAVPAGLALAACVWLIDFRPAAAGDATAPAEAPAASAKPAGQTPAKAGEAAAAKPEAKQPVSPGEVLSFRQAKVAAEMTELEERMFRLSEALKALEPENSSRLMLGLKFARDELILHQMKETQELLGKLSLDEAAGREKELLAKLQRLHDLLLSSDLDFQMQLEKLRQLREILRRLDKAIKEEDREKKQSLATAAKQRELEGLRKKRASLEELIKRQKGHIDESAKLADQAQLTADDEKSVGRLAAEQETTRVGTRHLAADAAKTGKDAKNLTEADTKMGEAGESLKQKKVPEAVPPEKEALAALEKEREATDEQLRVLEREVAEADFNSMKRDQAQNRQLNDGITQLTRDLGDRGAGALGELIRADGSMSNAENQLGSRSAEPASEQQEQALQSLRYAKEQLEEEAEKLAEQLRVEVKKRVMEGLTWMLERQIAVRESTELLGPKAKNGSRQALTALVGLARSEQRIVDVANELITLVEETEFGIALPAALLVVRDAMSGVQASLAAGDGSDLVVGAEREIEADLESLLDAIRKLPPSKSSGRGQRGQRDRRRELNRLIAELKMTRMLQIRTNRKTLDVDKDKPDALENLAAALRQQIEAVADQQDHVRDVTERLAESRGDELQGGN